MSVRIDALRERLLARELSVARTTLSTGGVRALVESARDLVHAAETERNRFSSLSSELANASPTQHGADIERYLRATSDDAKSLATDLRALRRGRRGVLDLAALGERSARRLDALECLAEACLAVARRAVNTAEAKLALPEVLSLAASPGRWSRRTEALALICKLARAGLSEQERGVVLATTMQLTSPAEHRWVQPAALAAMAAVDDEHAQGVARDRLANDAGGDDFIVRSRIVGLAARKRKTGWLDLLPLAAADRSVLVRMTAVRVEPSCPALERIARTDPSHKVRALALIQLRKRARAEAVEALGQALIHDRHEFVVRTAAEELVATARKSATLATGPRQALLAAATRGDLSPSVRAACADALAEIDLLTSDLRGPHAELALLAQNTPIGSSMRVSSPALVALSDDGLARILGVLARDDFALGLDRTRNGLVLHRSERRTFASWRALFELLHPGPSKRQAVLHTLGRRPRGALRAPPLRLAEVTATRVPGERVLVDNAGGWGRHLPLVDDLMSLGILSGRKVSLASTYGVTTVTAPRTWLRRLRAQHALTLGYSRFTELRLRALASQDPEIQASYVQTVARETEIEIEITPYAFDFGVDNRELPVPIGLARALRGTDPRSALSGLALSTGLDGWWDDLVNYSLSAGGSRLPELATYGLVLLFVMLARGASIRHRIEGDRKGIPLVMGGWGTRGKSGTERLKAALFQGLGYECLVKTTGCEAMFIHALPGLPAREIFIYRPYDKATVWEQRELLSLARRLSVRVFLWECMALQPELANLLQTQWMHDDCSTITNAYPDHEEVQGPTGLDVASTISEFVPVRAKLFTTEQQMLPLIRDKARSRGSKTNAVCARDAELIADDLLARFPYAEHPSNIALVAALARNFGISSTVAIAEMADHVVPDLGALKTYPAVAWRGRRLSFTNGMGANDRAGTLANFQRTGFAAHDSEAEPGRWIVTVVNNRADRLARSEVFAKLIVEDISAHRHVLIGTNVSGLLGFIEQALARYLEELKPSRDLPTLKEDRRRVVDERIDRAFARLKVGRTDAASLRAEQAALGFPPLDKALAETLLEPASATESYEAGREAVHKGLSAICDTERLPFLACMIARRRVVRAVHALSDQSLETNPAAVDAGFCAAYRALFVECVVPIYDAEVLGDEIIDRVASAVPSGAHASIMGIQNIKGTGLNFVYRWVSIGMVHRMLAGLRAPKRETREQALTQLMVHDDYGMIDAAVALSGLEQARAETPDRGELPYDAAIAKMREVVAFHAARAGQKRRTRPIEKAQKLVGETLDFLDSVRRRRMAGRVLRELVAGHISHASAALRMREIVARSKGMWMVRRS